MTISILKHEQKNNWNKSFIEHTSIYFELYDKFSYYQPACEKKCLLLINTYIFLTIAENQSTIQDRLQVLRKKRMASHLQPRIGSLPSRYFARTHCVHSQCRKKTGSHYLSSSSSQANVFNLFSQQCNLWYAATVTYTRNCRAWTGEKEDFSQIS